MLLYVVGAKRMFNGRVDYCMLWLMRLMVSEDQLGFYRADEMSPENV